MFFVLCMFEVLNFKLCLKINIAIPIAKKYLSTQIVNCQVCFKYRLDSLELQRDVASFCIFYCFYYGKWSEELFGLIDATSFRLFLPRQQFHPNRLDGWPTTTVLFSTIFLIRSGKLCHELSPTLLPNQYCHQEKSSFLNCQRCTCFLALQVSMRSGNCLPSDNTLVF